MGQPLPDLKKKSANSDLELLLLSRGSWQGTGREYNSNIKDNTGDNIVESNNIITHGVAIVAISKTILVTILLHIVWCCDYYKP